MSERIIADIPESSVASLRSMLEADGYSVSEETQPDGLITLHGYASSEIDIKPVKPWPKPGKG